MRRAVLTAVAVALAAVAVAVVVVVRHNADLTSVADLDRGDCVDGAPFLRGEQPALADLTHADCDDLHDAEVWCWSTSTPTRPRRTARWCPDEVCLDALGDQAHAAVSADRLLVAGVSDKTKPAGGDTLACFGFAADGTRLEGKVKTR